MKGVHIGEERTAARGEGGKADRTDEGRGGKEREEKEGQEK